MNSKELEVGLKFLSKRIVELVYGSRWRVRSSARCLGTTMIVIQGITKAGSSLNRQVEGDLLQDRIYRLMVKIRDALQNLDYSDDDLFRINGEVRSETCRLLSEIQAAGVNPGEDFNRVRASYEC